MLGALCAVVVLDCGPSSDPASFHSALWTSIDVDGNWHMQLLVRDPNFGMFDVCPLGNVLI